MGRQRGGAVTYVVPPFFKTPGEVLSVIEQIAYSRVYLPNPAQTIGVCAVDAVLTTLFYSDVLRNWTWNWVFDKYVTLAPIGEMVIRVPDEHLRSAWLLDPTVSPAVQTERQVDAFLATSAARILRILSNYPKSTVSLTRSTSSTPAPEMHGKTPSEICAILAVAIAEPERSGELYESLSVPGPPPPEAYNRTYGLTNYASASIISKVFSRIKRIPGARGGEGGVVVSPSPPLKDRSTVAIKVLIRRTRYTGNWFSIDRDAAGEPDILGHTVSFIRVNGKWYVSDDNIGYLVPIIGVGGAIVDEKMLEGSFPRQYIRKIDEETKRRLDISPATRPLLIRYEFIRKTDLKTVLATTAEHSLLGPVDEVSEAAPVGIFSLYQDATYLPDSSNGGFATAASLFGYVFNLEVTDRERESDARDTEEVKRADTENGLQFMINRGYDARTQGELTPDVLNTLRRIGKVYVRRLEIPIVPDVGGNTRVYCHVSASLADPSKSTGGPMRRKDTPKAVKAVPGLPKLSVASVPHPGFKTTLTFEQRRAAKEMLLAKLEAARSRAVPDAIERYQAILRAVEELEQSIELATDVNARARMAAELDVILSRYAPPPTGGRRYSRRSKQWGSRKVAGSSTRRRGSRRPNT